MAPIALRFYRAKWARRKIRRARGGRRSRNSRQDLIRGKIEGSAGVLEFLLYLLTIVAVPMVLHGFYDTLLKKQMNGLTLCVAIASFGWIAFQVERMSRLESQPRPTAAVMGI